MNEYYVERKNNQMQEYGMEFFKQETHPYMLGAQAHIHDAIEFLSIQEGKYHIFVNGIEYTAAEGDVLLFRSNAIHSIYAEDCAVNSYYVLKVKPTLFFELAAAEKAVSYVLRFSLSDSCGKTHWRAEELAGSEIKDSFEKLITGYFKEDLCKDISLKIDSYNVVLALLRDMIKKEEEDGMSLAVNDSAAAQIYKVIRYMNQNFREELDARECCKRVNMSYSYFSRCFKRVTGRSFREYLNEVRINHAQQLLSTSDMSVTQIAFECGYNNVSYFITVYKSIKGKTPFSGRHKAINNL